MRNVTATGFKQVLRSTTGGGSVTGTNLTEYSSHAPVQLLTCEWAHQGARYLLGYRGDKAEEKGADCVGGVYPNLFSKCPPMQVDANFGACAGIAEMWLQSSLTTKAGQRHVLDAALKPTR